ncbi:hypothetical protein [Sphingomonas sp.]
MTADPQPTLPDPRTANDDEDLGDGRSAPAPAEGADDEPGPNPGSPDA